MSKKLTCIRALIICAAVSMICFVTAESTSADVIIEQRINTDNLVIPTFNTALGTLQSVQLNITLLPGITDVVNPHTHAPVQAQMSSANTIFADVVHAFAPMTLQTGLDGGHTHGAASPSYSGGGLSITPFNVSLFSELDHSHNVTITYAGTQTVTPSVFGDDEVRVVVNIQPTAAAGNHNHSYSPANQVLNYSGAQLAPFTAVGDIVMLAPAYNTSTNPSHTHTLAPFNFPVNTNDGVKLVNFSGLNFSGYAMPGHEIDPRFTTTATFTYEPVPEPTSVALIGAGMLGMLRRRR